MGLKTGFDRKIFTAGTFWSDLRFLMSNRASIRAAMANPDLGKMFMEKVMMVVTAVNGCPYCSWFHTEEAASTGMSTDEMQDLFNLQFDLSAGEHELPALSFAQHYAETNRNPDPEQRARLDEVYGETTAGHIMLFIRMIFFGNLAGNTFDAFVSRFRGVKAEGSSVVFEALFFLISAPFMLPIKWKMHQKPADGVKAMAH